MPLKYHFTGSQKSGNKITCYSVCVHITEAALLHKYVEVSQPLLSILHSVRMLLVFHNSYYEKTTI